MTLNERTYWNEEFKGKCKSGFYIRCNLFEKIKHFEEMGYKVVGITVTDSWNLEFICEEPKTSKDSEERKLVCNCGKKGVHTCNNLKFEGAENSPLTTGDRK